ncbi:MAG: glycoside hydrolase [Flavobacterium sp.]|nr:glycoside hydrolase [Flavobacterium sp.]
MKSIKKNLLKFTTLFSLLVIVLGSIAYGSFRGEMSSPKNVGTLVEDTIKPVKIRDNIVNFGMDLLGTPYIEASSSKDGFDCSGFVYYVFKHHKIQVPRSSSQFKNFGKEIPIENVKKGDILLFLSPTRNSIGHIGIVTNPKGKHSDFIHASSGREMKVIISSLKQEGYTRRFVKAIDVLSAY